MMSIDENIVIVILFIIFLIWWLKPVEKFNTNFYGSVLETDMDKIKNNKGYTLNDYILSDSTLYGSGINSPF